MSLDRKNVRSKSMLGTVLFVLGIAAAVASLIVRSTWMTAAGAALLVIGAVMLFQVGRALRS